MNKLFLAFVMSLAVASSAFAGGFFDGNDGSKYGGPQPCGCAGPPGDGRSGGDSDGGGVTGGPSGGENGGGNGAGVSGPEGVGL